MQHLKKQKRFSFSSYLLGHEIAKRLTTYDSVISVINHLQVELAPDLVGLPELESYYDWNRCVESIRTRKETLNILRKEKLALAPLVRKDYEYVLQSLLDSVPFDIIFLISSYLA
jgi:cobalamin biosynthesis Co2+ chelatase CbiK